MEGPARNSKKVMKIEISSSEEDGSLLKSESESLSPTGTETLDGTSNTSTAGPVSKKSKRTRNRKKHKNPIVCGKFRYVCMAKEDHGQAIFGVQFNNWLKEGEPRVFATTGKNRVTVYECKEKSFKLLCAFQDPDTEEHFFCCAWSKDDEGNSLLAAGGFRGVIRLFSLSTGTCVKYFKGHGNSINDLIFHPDDPNLLLSASKDHTLRLWNIKTDRCIAIFGGAEGHRDEVLTVDFNFDGTFILSAGMDHSLKIWKLDKPEMTNVIKSSYNFNSKSTLPFSTLKVHFPEFSTRDIHRNYVDCAKFFGDCILSKSCGDEAAIVCWKPGRMFEKWDDILPTTTEESSVICRLDIEHCEIWFMKFCMNQEMTTLALGNGIGQIHVYDLDVEEPKDIESTPLYNKNCTAAIRQTAFSKDGQTLISVCDDGTIWRWDKGSSSSKN